MSDARNLGIVDITDPLVPQLTEEVALPGEPTSIAVTPDGSLARVVVNTSYLEEEEKSRIQQEQLIFVNPATHEVVASIAVGPGPDAIAVGNVGDSMIAAIAIENDAVVVGSAGNLRDGEDPGHPGDISQPGVLESVDIKLDDPGASTARTVLLCAADLAAAGLLYPDDPQPEFADICRGKVAVTLQENNGVVT